MRQLLLVLISLLVAVPALAQISWPWTRTVVHGVDAKGVGNDLTLQALRNLDHALGLEASDFKTEYFVSSYSGSDNNHGTRSSPIQTYGKCKDVALDGAVCTLKCGEVWSPLVLTMDENYGYQAGEGVDWNAGADVGVVVDVDPATKIIVLREVSGAGTDPDAADQIITLDNRITGEVASVTDTLGTGAADSLYPDCGAGEPCILIQGECGGKDMPLLDCNDTEPNGAGNALLGVNGNVDGEGWYQRIAVDHCNQDAVSQSLSADLVALNIPITNHVNVEGGQESANAITTHNTGDLVYVAGLNGKIQGTQDSDSGNGGGVALGSSGNHTIIGPDIKWDDNDQAAFTNPTVIENGTTTFVDTFIHGERGDGSAWIGTYINNAVNSPTLTFCRSVTDVGDTAGDAAVVLAPNMAGDPTINLYETTFADGPRGILSSTFNAAGSLTVFGRGVMFYGLTEWALVQSTAATSDNWLVDLEGIWDESKFHIDNVTRTIAQARTDAPHWTLFENNSNDPDGADLPWENTGGTLTMPQFKIHPDCGGGTGICYDEAITTYLCTLAQPIPKEVLDTGQDITALRLTGTIGR